MKKKRRSIKNIILKTVMAVDGFIWLMSVCALDSESWIPLMVCVVTGCILALFCIANDGFKECDD